MLVKKVLETIEKYNMIKKGDKIVVAVSGGPDSMTLLDVLIRLKTEIDFSIVVAHVNHMIREVADSETEYVEEFCKNNNVECFIKKADVLNIAKEQKISTEEAGRNIRYDFFEEVLNKTKSNKIAIAHNKNDNVETVLMNVIRGSGISGLKGIEPVRLDKFIRPLIEIERNDIEEYCKERNLKPKYDESNNENVYTRNKIRNLLIPYLKKEFNPNIIDSISRLSDLATQENEYIEKVIGERYENIVEKESSERIILDLKLFNSEDEFIKGKIILFCIQKLFGSTKGIEKIHIEDIITLCARNIGNKHLCPNKNVKVEINCGRIEISKTKD